MSNPYEELKKLIHSSEKKELQCKGYLVHAEDILFKKPGMDIEVNVEYRGHRGDSDLIVVGKGNVSGVDVNLAYIWELKAPQCYVFKKDPQSDNRLVPTSDLIKAENQLLNYYDELKHSEDFRDEYKITHSEYVHLGGIIIGNDSRKVDSDFSDKENEKLYRKSLRCRQLFYRNEIELCLWNRILNHLKPPEKPESVI